MSVLAATPGWILTLAATATPTPGEELPFNPDDVTPGPLGFFVFIFVAVATGLLVMDLIRRTSRVQARARIRAQLQSEIAAGESGVEAGADADVDTDSDSASRDHAEPPAAAATDETTGRPDPR